MLSTGVILFLDNPCPHITSQTQDHINSFVWLHIVSEPFVPYNLFPNLVGSTITIMTRQNICDAEVI